VYNIEQTPRDGSWIVGKTEVEHLVRFGSRLLGSDHSI